MNHLRQAWAIAATKPGPGRFVHFFLPEDPDEAHRALVSLTTKHTGSLRVVQAEVTVYDQARLHDTINNEGFSHHPMHGAAPSSGFMASYELGDGQAAVHHIKDITPEHIANHREAISEHLNKLDSFQGGWHDTSTGKVYLDASRHFHDEGKARDFALKNRQDAYFNLGNFESYYMNPKRDSLASSDPAAHAKKYQHITDKYGSEPPKEYESYKHLYEQPESEKKVASGKPPWLQGHPVGPWLSHPTQQREIEHRKNQR